MKIAIISDIHANLAALRAFPGRDLEELRSVGDLLGYGPRPRDVVQEIRRKQQLCPLRTQGAPSDKSPVVDFSEAQHRRSGQEISEALRRQDRFRIAKSKV